MNAKAVVFSLILGSIVAALSGLCLAAAISMILYENRVVDGVLCLFPAVVFALPLINFAIWPANENMKRESLEPNKGNK